MKVMICCLHCLLSVFDSFQYPKGLLHTVQELDVSSAVGVFPKTKFSMLVPDVEKVMPTLANGQLKHVVLFGIEVCTI